MALSLPPIPLLPITPLQVLSVWFPFEYLGDFPLPEVSVWDMLVWRAHRMGHTGVLGTSNISVAVVGTAVGHQGRSLEQDLGAGVAAFGAEFPGAGAG